MEVPLWTSVIMQERVFSSSTWLHTEGTPFSMWVRNSTTGTIHLCYSVTIKCLHLKTFSFLLSELNALHEEMKPLGLTVLGFPCNQFGKQEPGQKHEILPGLKWEIFLFQHKSISVLTQYKHSKKNKKCASEFKVSSTRRTNVCAFFFSLLKMWKRFHMVSLTSLSQDL